MTKNISRRRLLRGIATGSAFAFPLPRLGGMLNGNGTAYADETPLPRRFGAYFFGNGIIPARWVPAQQGVGAAWQLSEELAPLAKVKRKLHVATGLEVKGPGITHWKGRGVAMTGLDINPAFKNEIPGPTIDQVIAKAVGGATAIRSLELKASDQEALDVCATGVNASLPMESDPRKVFSRVFMQTPARPGDPAAATALRLAMDARRSVLDSVREDAADLRRLLGREDQRRLDQHLEGVRTLETRLTLPPLAVTTACGTAKPPSATKMDLSDVDEDVKNGLHDVLALALACDVTRVFSFALTKPASHMYFRRLGIADDFHDTVSHKDPDEAGFQPRVHAAVVFQMQCLAQFLERLDAIAEGSGTLLDNCLVYTTSCTSWGKAHTFTDYPVLLAGRGGGALKGDVHYRSAANESVSKALFTVARVMGLDVKEMGSGTNLVSDGLTAFGA